MDKDHENLNGNAGELRTEAALRVSELIYRRLFEAAQDGILILDVDTGRITDVNPFLVKLLGYSRQEIIGRTVGELSPFKDVVSNQAMLEKLQQDGYVRYEDLPLKTLGGRDIAVEFVSNVYQAGDKKVIQCNIRDITERKRTEVALRESKRFLRSTLDALLSHIAILDEQGMIVEVNAAWNRFASENHFTDGNCGVGENYLRVCDSAAEISPSEAVLVAAGIRAVMSGQREEFHLEYPCHSPQERRWFMVRVTRFAGTGPVRIVVAHENITERKQAEAALQQSEKKFRDLIENMQIGVVAHDAETAIQFSNPTAARLLGLTPDQMLGKKAIDLAWCFNREDGTRLPLDEYPVNLARLTTQSQLANLILGICIPGRETPTWVQCNTHQIRNQAGQLQQIVVTFFDITARKVAEKELLWKTALLEAQLEASIDGILVVGTEGQQVLQNRRMTELWKFPAAIIAAKDEAAQLRYATSQTKNSRQFIERVEYLYAHPDETSQDEVELVDGTIMDRYSAPIWDQSGKHYGRIWSFRDITERRKLEQNIQQTQKMESIGQLAGGIAHDFNNILSCTIGYLYLAKAAAANSPDVLGYLEHIEKATDRATALVQQILTFSRRDKPEREPIDLNQVVLEALKLLRASLPATIRIKTELTETPAVLANATAIHQVIMNLGTNAMHAMRDQPGMLKVEMGVLEVDEDFARTHPDLHPGRYVKLSVSDTGCGMDRATAEHIFEPFFTTKGVGEGTGLGLAVVHGIMKTHDGGISVYSQPGMGTTFHLYFPVLETEAVTLKIETAPIPRGQGERILFVDDEEVLASLGKQILERLGYRVTTTSSVLEALALVRAQTEPFELVITDLAMPVMDGVKLGGQLLQLQPQLRIILTTGFNGFMSAEKVRELGFCDLLNKPSTARTLGETVHRVLHPAAVG